MKMRLLLVLALTLSLVACGSLKGKNKASKDKKPPVQNMPDANKEISFQAFVGRLRTAVSKHDTAMVASMMTSNFGYRLEPPGEGEGVFQYWDEKGLWNELELVLKEKFVPSGNFMVAPPQFTFEPDYHGYRAGIIMTDGNWRFAYFVTD